MKRWRAIEMVLGILFVLLLVAKSGSRLMLRVWLAVAFHQATALIPLLRADFLGTAASFALMLARLGIALVPSVILIRAAPARRKIWLIAAVTMVVVFCSPVSLSSCQGAGAWAALVALSGAAAFLARRRYLGWTAFAPFVVLLQSMPSHVLAAWRSNDAPYRARLLAECQKRDGQLAANLTVELVKPAHAISPLGDDRFLLTGQGPGEDIMFGKPDDRPGSWWMRRQDGRLVFDSPSAAQGRFWRGCLLDGALWSAQAGRLIGARRDGQDEQIARVRLPSKDTDMGDTACDDHHLYIGEGTRGAVWEMTLGRNRFRRHEIGGVALLPERRFDGQIVVGSTSHLNLFAPGEDRVVERVPSALLSVGFDLCGSDGTAAVADEAGRLRVFALENGRYRFAWGLPLFAPRRVAYSPDCSHLAVTSSDDHSVFIIDVASRAVVATHQAGPALREVTATAPREFTVADACAATSYSW